MYSTPLSFQGHRSFFTPTVLNYLRAEAFHTTNACIAVVNVGYI